MGVMSATAHAILEHKKQPFLKAFLRTGKVAPAARAARVSRDFVYDALKNDASFRRQFNLAKRGIYDHRTAALSECFEFFLAIVKPIVPSDIYPRVVAAMNLTLMQRNFKDGSSSTAHSASRKQVRLPSFDVHPESANSVNDGSRNLHSGKNETLT